MTKIDLFRDIEVTPVLFSEVDHNLAYPQAVTQNIEHAMI